MISVRKFEYDIDERWQDKEIKAFLKHEGFSAAAVSSMKKNPKGILLGRKRVTVLKTLHAGDHLTLRVREVREHDYLQPTRIQLDIVYEDEDIVVINKPAGMPTHPVQNNHTHTLANALVYHWQQQKTAAVYHPISRLDKDTTGLLLVAKNAHSAAKLSDAVRHREVTRVYLALAMGTLCGSGRIDAPIVRCPDSVIKRCIGTVETEKSRAVTHYRAVAQFSECTLLLLRLETGRTHQIRVHTAHIGYPLCGDWLYGEEGYLLSRPALHSYYLSFTHPISGRRLSFFAPLPADMEHITGTIEINEEEIHETFDF